MKEKLLMILTGILLISSLSFIYADIIWSDGTTIEFEITSLSPVCSKANTVWRWWNLTIQEVEETSSLNDCYRENGLSPTGAPSRTCCPDDGPECFLDDPLALDFGKCKGLTTANFCYDYKPERYGGDVGLAKSYCNNANENVANRSMVIATGIDDICHGHKGTKIIGGKTCDTYSTQCRCEWDNINNNCTAKNSVYSICPGDSELSREGNCSFREFEKIDDCENSGYIKYSWKAIWEDGVSEPPGWCEDSTRRFRCATKLFFFTITSLIIAVIVIMIIYLVWFRKKKEKLKIRKREIKRRK